MKIFKGKKFISILLVLMMLFSSLVYASQSSDDNISATAVPIATDISTPTTNEQVVENNLDPNIVNATDENISTPAATPTANEQMAENNLAPDINDLPEESNLIKATSTPSPSKLFDNGVGMNQLDSLLPDLVVTNISWSPVSPNEGSVVTFSATIKNQGTGASPGDVWQSVVFMVDGVTKSLDMRMVSIPVGQFIIVTSNGYTWTVTSGNHTISALVDDVNRIAESDEYNNTLTTGMDIRPDLVVDDITWLPASPMEGNAISFLAKVSNIGKAKTPNGVWHSVIFYVDGVETNIGNQTVSILPGNSVTITAGNYLYGPYWTAVKGSHTVTALVDDVNRIDESNETNNWSTPKPIVVNALPTPYVELHYGNEGVYAPSGNYSRTDTDLYINSPGFSTGITRVYNSMDTTNISGLGKGWQFNFDSMIEESSYSISGTTYYLKRVHYPDGSIRRFTTTSNGSTYTCSTSESRDTLAYNNGIYTLTTIDHYKYNYSQAKGCRLTSISDELGNTISITRDGSNRIDYITDSASRVFDFQYPLSTSITVNVPGGNAITYTLTSGKITSVNNGTSVLENYVYNSGISTDLLSDVKDDKNQNIEKNNIYHIWESIFPNRL